MDIARRRMEIISVLSVKGHTTMRELAWELDVSRRTIMNDVIVLSFLPNCLQVFSRDFESFFINTAQGQSQTYGKRAI